MCYSINLPQIWRWNVPMQSVGQFVLNRQAREDKLTAYYRPMSATASRQQRIVLANQPRLLREMLGHVFVSTAGLQVIAALDDPAQLSEIIREAQPTWLIVTLGSNSWELLKSLSCPAGESVPSLLAISVDGKQIEVHTTNADGNVQSYSLYDISLENLLAILR